MKIKDIVDTLEATVYYGEELMDVDIHSACASDMMSDVLAFVKDQALLISGLCNPQVVRTADMMDIKCKFGKKFGIDYDDFTALDLPDMLDGDGMENPSKYMLYSDPFLGYMDSTVDEGKARFFAEAKTKIDKSVSNKEYGYIHLFID